MPLFSEECSKMIFFVKLIEKNPCLWNFKWNSNKSSRADEMNLAWMKIATEMNETEEVCRERWRNIRTAFGRTLKLKLQTGRLKKPYYLSRHLSFLLPFMKNASNLEENEDTEAASNSTLPAMDPHKAECDQMSEELCNVVDCDVVLRSPPSKRKTEARESDTEKPVSNRLEVNRLDETVSYWESPADDADWLFFQSILPDFKKLSDRRRRDLKAKFMLLLNEQLDEAENDTS